MKNQKKSIQQIEVKKLTKKQEQKVIGGTAVKNVLTRTY